jgi:hypothetical protein
VTLVLLALLFIPALLASAFVLWRWRRADTAAPVRILAEAAPAAATISGSADPLAALDDLLSELERATVRIDGSDELDEAAVVELERLADRLEAAAQSLEGVA